MSPTKICSSHRMSASTTTTRRMVRIGGDSGMKVSTRYSRTPTMMSTTTRLISPIGILLVPPVAIELAEPVIGHADLGPARQPVDQMREQPAERRDAKHADRDHHGFASKNACANPRGVRLRRATRSGLGGNRCMRDPSVAGIGCLNGQVNRPQSSVRLVYGSP